MKAPYQTIRQIIRLQTFIRGFLGRKKYKYFDFLINQIVYIQKIFRGYITRKKFAKFMDCYKKIVLIQRVYHKRYKKMIVNAIKIQINWKRFKQFQKLKDKLAQKKRHHFKENYGILIQMNMMNIIEIIFI